MNTGTGSGSGSGSEREKFGGGEGGGGAGGGSGRKRQSKYGTLFKNQDDERVRRRGSYLGRVKEAAEERKFEARGEQVKDLPIISNRCWLSFVVLFYLFVTCEHLCYSDKPTWFAFCSFLGRRSFSRVF